MENFNEMKPFAAMKGGPVFNDQRTEHYMTNLGIQYFQAGYVNNVASLFGDIAVPYGVGNYPVWNKADLTRQHMKPVTEGSVVPTENLSTSQKSISVNVNGTAFQTGDQFLAQTDEGYWHSTKQAFAMAMADQALMFKEQQVVDNLIKPGVWATDFAFTEANAFTNPDTDVIRTMGDRILAFQERNSGRKPNTLILDPWAMQELRNHPDLKEWVNSSQIRSGMGKLPLVASGNIAAALGLDRVVTPNVVTNTAKEEQAEVSKFIHKKGSALLCYVTSAPSRVSPSCAYNFTWSRFQNQSIVIRHFRKEEERVDKYEITMASNIKICANYMGEYWSGLLTPQTS